MSRILIITMRYDPISPDYVLSSSPMVSTEPEKIKCTYTYNICCNGEDEGTELDSIVYATAVIITSLKSQNIIGTC